MEQLILGHKWEDTYLEAVIWYCGDEICDCHQPQIDRISPNFRAGYPWIKREPIWRGTFISGPTYSEYLALEKELEDEKSKRRAE